MADTKISALTASAGLALEDLIATVDDPSGTPATKKATLTQLAALIGTFATKLYHFRDQQTSGTAGGTFTAGAWRTRTINTEVTDEIGVTLSSNQMTFPAGTYFIIASAPAYNVTIHKTKLYNATGAADLILGTSEYGVATVQIQTRSWIIGRFTVAASQALEIQHQCSSTQASDGFGRASSYGTEVYTEGLAWEIPT